MSCVSRVFDDTTSAGARGAVWDRHLGRGEVKMLDLSEPEPRNAGNSVFGSSLESVRWSAEQEQNGSRFGTATFYQQLHRFRDF